MPQDVQIRPELIKTGFTNEDIGYDEGRKMTTLKGQDFIGKDNFINVAGSTFTDRQNFDNALKKFKQNQQIADVQNRAFNTTPTVNPYDQRIDQLFNDFQSRVQNPTPVDPFSTPQFAAAQAQMAQQADRGIRAAQESLGSAGFGRSTTLADNAQRVQNDADQFLQTQMLPQIVQQLQAEEDRKTQGIFQLLNSLMGQQGVFDTRSANERNSALDQLDFLTGRQDRAQDIQREDESITRASEYQTKRDQITDERDKRDFDEDVRRFGLDFAAQEADRKAQQADRNAQRGLEQQRINISKAELEVREKEAAARTVEENAKILREESQGLTETLRAGEMTPAQALKQIDQDLALGFYTPEQARELKRIVSVISPTVSASAQTELTDEQQNQVVTGKALDKLFKESGKGKPEMDWKKWYNDSRGRLAGVDYDTWHRLYGPEIKGK